MMARQETRGRPLIVLGLMATAWLGMRFALWPQETIRMIEDALPPVLLADTLEAPMPDGETPFERRGFIRATESSQVATILDRQLSGNPSFSLGMRDRLRPDRPGSHNLLWLSALTPSAFQRALATSGASENAGLPEQPLASPAGERQDRWSLDAWSMWRNDTGASLAPRSYGGSQAGLLLRYRIAPSSRLAPRLFVRATASPRAMDRPEVAGGVSLRPVAGLPIDLQVEMRLREKGGRIEARPAIAAIGGLDRRIAGLDLRAFGQAGYVAGNEATAFADGKLTLEKTIASGSGFRIAAGAGAWGGAQDGSSRVDAGPVASLTVSTGRATARVEADYRVRVAGDAGPDSGPAITISASF